MLKNPPICQEVDRLLVRLNAEPDPGGGEVIAEGERRDAEEMSGALWGPGGEDGREAGELARRDVAASHHRQPTSRMRRSGADIVTRQPRICWLAEA